MKKQEDIVNNIDNNTEILPIKRPEKRSKTLTQTQIDRQSELETERERGEEGGEETSCLHDVSDMRERER